VVRTRAIQRRLRGVQELPSDPPTIDAADLFPQLPWPPHQDLLPPALPQCLGRLRREDDAA
jgi:hypothetical protein